MNTTKLLKLAVLAVVLAFVAPTPTYAQQLSCSTPAITYEPSATIIDIYCYTFDSNFQAHWDSGEIAIQPINLTSYTLTDYHGQQNLNNNMHLGLISGAGIAYAFSMNSLGPGTFSHSAAVALRIDTVRLTGDFSIGNELCTGACQFQVELQLR